MDDHDVNIVENIVTDLNTFSIYCYGRGFGAVFTRDNNEWTSGIFGKKHSNEIGQFIRSINPYHVYYVNENGVHIIFDGYP
jgi:hypothetical protein